MNYGSEILIATSGILINFLPNYAHYGRWGGEEFLFVFNNDSLIDTCNLAKCIKRALNTTIFTTQKPLSAGFDVTQFKRGDNLTTILTRTVQTVYKAMGSGRNIVVCG